MVDTTLVFLKEAIRLKRMIRSGWIYSGIQASNVESVADHSYFVSLIALVITLDEQSKGSNLDLEKILIMSLIHDLSECISQDIDRRVRKFSPTNYDVFKKKMDEGAFSKLVSSLPNNIKKKISSIYDEYQDGVTNEAKLVKEADRLETILQLNEYIKLGYKKKNFSEFIDNFNDEKNNYQFDLVKELTSKLLENKR